MEFLAAHLVEIFFGLVSAGALAFCKYFHSKLKKYQKLSDAEHTAQLRKMILDEIEPIVRELKELEHKMNDKIHDITERIDNYDIQRQKELDLTLASYKFRLIQLCKTHLADGYISQKDFDQISELYKVYHGLGGNGQAQEYYEKVLELPIKG